MVGSHTEPKERERERDGCEVKCMINVLIIDISVHCI